MCPVESGSAAAIKSWRSARERAGAARAIRARRREGVGRRVGSEDEDEDEGWVVVVMVVVVVVVANKSNAARMEASVEALIRCCFAREEGGSLGAGMRENGGGGGGLRERRFGGWMRGVGFYFSWKKVGGDRRRGGGV